MTKYTVTIDLPEPLYQRLTHRSQQSQRTLEEELLSLIVTKVPAAETLENMPLAYKEVVEFLGSGATAEEISGFRLSAEAQAQARSLLEKNRAGTLGPAEEAELDLYIELEELMGLVKVQALQQLQSYS